MKYLFKIATISTFYKYINITRVYFLKLGNRVAEFFDNTCYMMSLNFVASQIAGFMPPILFKLRYVFPSFGRSALNTVRAVQKYKCRNLIAAPKLLFEIFDSVELSSQFDLSSLRCILSGSQIVAPEVIERAFLQLSQFDSFLIIYGQTELLITNLLVVTNQKSRLETNLSVGLPLPHIEQKVVDPITKAVVPKNTPGELYTKSFSMFNEYWKDGEKTKEAIDPDGWFEKVILYFTYFEKK